MQFKLAFVAAALATLAAATPSPNGEPASSCTTGPVKCCQTTGDAITNPTCAEALATPSCISALLAIGVVAADVTGLVGLTCTDVVGGSCASQAVCCEDNAQGGLISVGCVPVTL